MRKRQRRHFIEERWFMVENFNSKDLRLFVSNVALSAETDDVDAWFVDWSFNSHDMQ
jgi:hypothetical protein